MKLSDFQKYGMKPVYLLNEMERRVAAVSLARYAVDDAEGRKLGDPIHEWITEGRRGRNESRMKKLGKPPSYSSCGDLAHWMLMCLGCRDERVVNRGDDGGTITWRSTVNISRLRYSPWFVPAGSPLAGPDVGDIILVANQDDGYDSHVAVLLSIEDTRQWVTADYGQPYGQRRVCQIVDTPRGRVVRGKRLRGWVDLGRVPMEPPAWVPMGCVAGADYDNPYLAD